MKVILVTGAAGFIGYHLCESLLKQGHFVIGLDNINDYYDVSLKYARLHQLGIEKESASVFLKNSESTLHGSRMQFIRMNLEDRIELPKLFKSYNFDIVCNLAAQAGVRYSVENPEAYINSNINGFLNVLECCRHQNVKRLVYASSSSVYGNTDKIPFDENTNVDLPISLYAATKKSNELMAHTYSHLYKIETIGLRFFTVYGPWGRPDMAMFLFTDAILNNKPIDVFNNGNLSRDFTYIDDIVQGVVSTLLKDSKNISLYKLYNIGNGKPVQLLDFIKSLEKVLDIKATKNLLPMQDGDMYQTFASTSKLEHDIEYKPKTKVDDGIYEFVKWYKNFYNI
ncbi:MAG: NAD-dependent epimerase [Flavobacteriaceae bacterium]|nr:NAD-dependent epimerase [Flavobacteriaceae bacterium]|tara:strand:- start:247 stop:1266 length:1020 start_codon:yes stop_codon:yes gene_type:complete